MSTRIVTANGDTLDRICWRHYGSTENRVVESVLEANRGLADYGPVLPAGIEIVLPSLVQPSRTRGVRLWD